MSTQEPSPKVQVFKLATLTLAQTNRYLGEKGEQASFSHFHLHVVGGLWPSDKKVSQVRSTMEYQLSLAPK